MSPAGGSGALIAVQSTSPEFLGLVADRRGGADVARAHLMVQVSPRDAPVVEARLAAMRELTALHQITGEFDLVAVIEASKGDELERAVERIRALDGVRRLQASLMKPR